MIDGESHFLYERKAIIEYIEKEGVALDGYITSPTTGKPLSPTLIPAHQARNAILQLAASGILDAYLTTEWKEVL